MNWYKNSAKEDQSVESYLSRLGVPEETISYVTTITDQNLKQQVIGYLRKFPQTPSSLLIEKIKTPIQTKQSLNTPEEIDLINRYQNVEFQKWALAALRKARTEYDLNHKQRSTLTGQGYHFDSGNFNFTIIRQIMQEVFDWYVRALLPAKQEFQKAQTQEEKTAIINEYGIPNPNLNISSLSLSQAKANDLAKNWHDLLKGEGKGLEYYKETKEDIVFGPKWSKPEWTGWTIKQVKTKNNLRTEGEKVGHCVGLYCADVENGKTRIFSLRDPSNNPHVTIEVDSNDWTFRQIQGNGPKTGNQEPSKVLKSMIGEWMRTLKNPRFNDDQGFDYSNLEYRNLDEDLEKSIYKEYEGYGLPVSIQDWDYKDAYISVYKILEKVADGYGNNGGRQTRYVAEILAKAAVDCDLERLEKGLFDKSRISSIAMNLVRNEPKNSVINEHAFNRMSLENKKTLSSKLFSRSRRNSKKTGRE